MLIFYYDVLNEKSVKMNPHHSHHHHHRRRRYYDYFVDGVMMHYNVFYVVSIQQALVQH
jgi:hypothetical protein